MAVRLLLAPAAAGKTACVLRLVRDAAHGLLSTPRVVVPTHLQVRAWRRRLAESGGAIGVRLMTFDRLYAECLNAAAEAYTELSEPVQYRLIRAVVDGLYLDHYAPLVTSPGFIQILERLIAELKAARVHPDDFSRAVDGMGSEPRLSELAQIYAAYQERLQAQGWADRAGLGWLAVEALEERAPQVANDWPLLVVDGFDSFTSVQLALLKVLAGRVGETIITLTGTTVGSSRPLVHRRFDETRHKLEGALGIQATPIPRQAPHQVPALAHLEAHLYRTPAVQEDAGGSVELIEAPDRAAEVRAALRWLKARLVEDGMRPVEVALLARTITPYRPFVRQIAAEFSLPVRLMGGFPLRSNPAIAALLDLLRLVLPGTGDEAEPLLPRRLVVEAWRSPYFDWAALSAEDAPEPIGISLADADTLDAVARWGRVIGGLSQWEKALANLTALGGPGAGGDAPGLEDDQEDGWPRGVPQGPAAGALRGKFQRFIERLTPPPGERSVREFVQWLEALIGPDPMLQSPRFPTPEEPTALQIVAQARRSVGTAEQDVAALRALKDILRGLVWAEEALATGPHRFGSGISTAALPSDTAEYRFPSDTVPSLGHCPSGQVRDMCRSGILWDECGPPRVAFSEFFDELTGAVNAAVYQLPADPARAEVVVADLVQARGVPFRAVAVLGLAEGEFPAVIGEDPFLRDADRQHLRDGYGLALEPSTQSAEAEFFYETVTRPRERLLLTRPRLADNGALWQASPFWEEVRRLVRVTPQMLTSESTPLPDQVASWPELMESLACHQGYSRVRNWVQQTEPARQSALDLAVQVLYLRSSLSKSVRSNGFSRPQAAKVATANKNRSLLRQTASSIFDGDLSELDEEFDRLFDLDHTWSASRLESFRTCPFFFYVGSVLGLAPRVEPSEGLDARQLGTLYHRLLQEVFQAPGVSDATDLGQLLQALPAVGAAILDAAPEQQGFRETAWWAQTRAEILENVRRSLEALSALPGGFVPYQHEAAFGLYGQPPLVVPVGDGSFRLRGFIDRVDRAPDGRVRVIDYKTAGPWAYTHKAVAQGKKLQLPLYALAARDALGVGEPVEGFYWHVRHAESSPFQMSKFDGGPAGAMDVAVEKAWEAVRGARDGHFVPRPPDDGCPAYCPAAGFCWHYQPGYGG